ncbi:IS200/IS605 family transposase [Cohnella fermenti]|uniref:IS200/IS605 family transposase n=1 Tax=Cohnella fermenti TaxID=2565925 RepID=A0A4S4BEQ2_9BACL|nr:IS200/IS605 family transposase [Cohnella fermenti]THF72493.1 IS200/IS605 family transposase [Cohnella fermenti]
MDNSSLSHTKWDCTYHIVFIPKYRRKVMYGELRNDIREIIKKLCEYREVAIVEGSVCADHIHLCVKIPPKTSVSEFMGYLKGKSVLMIFDRHPEYRQKGNRHFWAKGYYVNTVGRNEAEIRKYIQNQVEADQLEDKKQ